MSRGVRCAAEQRTEDSAPIVVRHSAMRCGGRDRNWRRGHSRLLERWRTNEDSHADQLNKPAKPPREVLADDSYRDHRANVEKMARHEPRSATI